MTHDDLLELFEEADRSIDEGNITEAKRVLEQIIQEDPSFGRAHNHLGWIYDTKLNDLHMAENHYKLAIRFEPSYPAPYFNYSYLLQKMQRYEEALTIINQAFSVHNAYKPDLHSEMGYIYELQARYDDALEAYEKAIKVCLDTDRIERYKADIARCQDKIKRSLGFWQNIIRNFRK